MRLQIRTIPGVDPALVRLHVVATEPRGTRVGFAVDPEGVGRGPLVRDRGPAHLLLGGRRITDPGEQRAGLPPAVSGPGSHLATWRGRHPDRDPVAVVGCGNLGMNPGVLLSHDGTDVGIAGAWGLALTVDGEGRGRSDPDRDPPPGGFNLSGPALVLDGQPAPLRPETYADPRHLLLFPYVALESGARLDFGQDRILNDPDLYRSAASGQPVALPLRAPAGDRDAAPESGRTEAIAPTALRAALATKGYRETSQVETRGTFRLGAGELEISFLPGIYPHHVLAADAQGRVHSLLIEGLSNRAGVGVEELAADLTAAGFTQALLVDNGGDVGLYLPREDRFAVRPAEADRSARWPLTACLIYHEKTR